MDTYKLREEKYFWETKSGEFIPINQLTDLHVFNIVAYFGKKWLEENGHSLIIERFNQLDAEHRWSKDLDL